MPSDNIKLDGDPSGLIQALDRAVTAWNNYNRALEINAKAMNLNLEATKQVSISLRDYSAGARAAANQQQRLNRSVATGKKQMDSSARSTKKLASDTAVAKARADALAGAFLRTSDRAKQANRSVLQLGVSLSGMARLVGVQLTHRAISALARSLVEGARESIELQKGLAEIRTISQQNQLTLDKWLVGVKALSNAYGVDLKDQVEATYQTLSNQIAEGAETFTFLADANDFAAAAVTSTSDAVNLLTGALNAYGLGADQTNRVSAQFFKTIELGRVRASEMANSFGDIAIVASQLNIGLDETQAAVSTLTIRGVAYNKAATQLRGIFIKLLKPTKAMKEFFRDIGVESGEAAIRTFGFDGVMARLRDTTKGSATELAKYISRVRGLSGGLVFTNEGLEVYRKNLDEIRNSTDSYGKAVDEVLNNSGKRADLFLTKMKNALLTAGSHLVEFYTEWFDADTNFFKEAERQRKELHRRESVAQDLNNVNKAYEDAVQARTRLYEQEVAAFRGAMNEQVDTAVEGYETIRDEALKTGGLLVESISDSINKSTSRVAELTKEIVDANKRIVDLVREEDETLFEWSQDTKNTAEQIAAITGRIAEQQAKRDEALRNNNKRALDEYNKDIIKFIKERKTLTDTLNKENIKALKEEKKLVNEAAKIKRDAAVKLAQLEQQRTGISGKGAAAKRNAIERKIFDLVRKRNEKLASIASKHSKIIVLENRKIQHARDLTAEIQKQRDGYRQIAEANVVIINQERQKIVDQELLKADLKSLIKDFKSFDIGEAATIADPEKLRKVIVERQKLNEKLVQFQRDRGVRSEGLLGLGDAAIKETQVLIDSLKILEEVQQRRTKIEELQKEQAGFKASIEATKAEAKELLKLKESYDSVQDALHAIATQEFVPEFRKTLDDLRKSLAGFFDEAGRVKDARGAFETLQEPFVTILNASGNPVIQPLAAKIGELRVELNKVKDKEFEMNSALSEFNLKLELANKRVAALKTGNERLLAESRKQIVVEDTKKAKTEDLIETQKRLLRILQEQTKEMQKQGVVPNARTAPIAQQAFGDIMRGSDNMLALRQKGEGVVNAKSTRKFYSQLVAMNTTPQSVVTGTTGGTTVGDINVTMNASGNLGYDAAALGGAIKRAARRGLV